MDDVNTCYDVTFNDEDLAWLIELQRKYNNAPLNTLIAAIIDYVRANDLLQDQLLVAAVEDNPT